MVSESFCNKLQFPDTIISSFNLGNSAIVLLNLEIYFQQSLEKALRFPLQISDNEIYFSDERFNIQENKYYGIKQIWFLYIF